jgi:hypothetical protein
MVKLSRRVHRKSKRIYSKKSLKGGKYEGPGKSYLRKKMGSTLYKLTSEMDDNNNMVYTLDFSVAGGMALGFKNTFGDLAKQYAEILKKAMGVFDGSEDATRIEKVIKLLFDGGVDGAKNRLLKITQPPPTAINLSLFKDGESMANEVIEKPADFGSFLLTLGDNIKPE